MFCLFNKGHISVKFNNIKKEGYIGNVYIYIYILAFCTLLKILDWSENREILNTVYYYFKIRVRLSQFLGACKVIDLLVGL
jgi:hypothetical protein